MGAGNSEWTQKPKYVWHDSGRRFPTGIRLTAHATRGAHFTVFDAPSLRGSVLTQQLTLRKHEIFNLIKNATAHVAHLVKHQKRFMTVHKYDANSTVNSIRFVAPEKGPDAVAYAIETAGEKWTRYFQNKMLVSFKSPVSHKDFGEKRHPYRSSRLHWCHSESHAREKQPTKYTPITTQERSNQQKYAFAHVSRGPVFPHHSRPCCGEPWCPAKGLARTVQPSADGSGVDIGGVTDSVTTNRRLSVGPPMDTSVMHKRLSSDDRNA